MTRRLSWFLAGAATALWARRQVVRFVDRFMPASVRDQVSSRASALRGDLRDAVDDGRAAMRDRAAGMRDLPDHVAGVAGSSPPTIRSSRPRPHSARPGRLPSVG